jgi:hypothetical protein
MDSFEPDAGDDKNTLYTLTYIQENMVPIFDPGNFLLVLMLFAVIGFPLSVLTVAIFFVIRQVPSRLAQCLIPLVAGIIVVVTYTSMLPPDEGSPASLMFLTGVLGNPLLFLPPITLMQKYLHRIPVLVAVFFTAFISMGLLITLGALQGDIRQVEPVNIAWQSMKTIIMDLIVASAVSGFILWGDNLLTISKKKHEQDSEGRIREGEK